MDVHVYVYLDAQSCMRVCALTSYVHTRVCTYSCAPGTPIRPRYPYGQGKCWAITMRRDVITTDHYDDDVL